TNPELGLKLHVGWTQVMMESKKTTWQGINADLQSAYGSNRWRKTGVLPPSVKLGTLVGPTISSDGSLLLACNEPSTLVMIDLNKNQNPTLIPIPLSANSRRRVLLDSCAISISRDNRFAIVQLTTDAGVSELNMVRLSQTGGPAMDIAAYDS